MADKWTKEKRSEVMSKIRSKNTKPELLLRKALFHKGYRYRIHNKQLPGKPDIIITKSKVAIFVHGCFWHYHDKCQEGKIPKSNSTFWQEKFEKNLMRDAKNQSMLSDMGWKIVVAWECEIEKNLNSVIQTIENQL